MPRNACRPIREVNCAINPNTAQGASHMAQRTTVMQTSCNVASRSSIGIAFSRAIMTSATPTTVAKMTTCSMFDSTIEDSGLEGSSDTKCCGRLFRLGATAADELTMTADTPNPARISAASTKSPGRMSSASQTPMVTATAVVTTK